MVQGSKGVQREREREGEREREREREKGKTRRGLYSLYDLALEVT